MNAVFKKKIVCFSSDILAFSSVFTAIFCLFIKLKNLTNYNFDNLNLFAAKSVFSSGINFKNLKNNIFCKANLNNIYPDSGNNNFNSQNKPLPSPTLPFNIDLPSTPQTESGEEYHDPNEKTYKIIESQFGSSGTRHENFFVKNTTDQNINIGSELSQKPDIHIKNTAEPQVLIFHTHTSESYMNKDQNFFYENFYPRSLDNEKNVTQVGKIITEKLIKNGINTIHDMTYHDNPTYNGSYSRAAKTIKNNLEKYPSLQVIIDIHRDSLGSKESGKIKPTFKYSGKKAAQMMIVSGCDPDNSLGFPDWEKNLRLALRLQKYCETMFPGITRPLNFAKVKYNQHLTPGSLLIEVGSDVNTLEEAINTGSMIGEALSKLLNDLKKEGWFNLKNKKNLKLFFISMFLTMQIITLFAGLIIIEKSAEEIIKEKNSDFLTYNKKDTGGYEVKLHFMGKNFIFNV